MTDKGTLAPTEPHPSAQLAYNYVVGLGLQRLAGYMESFSSCAIEDNRLAEVCSETLRRLLANEPVSDRYILGLAWAIKSMEEEDDG